MLPNGEYLQILAYPSGLSKHIYVNHDIKNYCWMPTCETYMYMYNII